LEVVAEDCHHPGVVADALCTPRPTGPWEEAETEVEKKSGPSRDQGSGFCYQSGEIVNTVQQKAVDQLTGAPATSAAEVKVRRTVKRILV